MSDSIVKSVSINGADGKLSRYVVTFSIDLSSIHKGTVMFNAVIPVSRLKNPTDLEEVKTLAHKQACDAKKRMLVPAEVQTPVAISGPVTL